MLNMYSKTERIHRQTRFLTKGIMMVLFDFAIAQSDLKSFELGAQFSTIRADRFDPRLSPGKRVWDPGFGGRFTANVTNNIGIEAEINYFPNVDESDRLGNKTQGLFGLKVGQRGEKFGVFAKLRPGFMRFASVFDCPGTDTSSCGRFAKTYFSFDFGGVGEFYPSHRTVVRFDVGDTVIRFNRITVPDAISDVPRATHPIKGATTHNLQLGIGVGIRF